MNPVFAAAALSEDSFRERLFAGLGLYPAYYAQMAGINRRGPPVVGNAPSAPALRVAAFADAAARGATVVDGRSRGAFAAGHLPGSMNMELNESFASYVGWLLPFDAPLALILPGPASEALPEAVTQLFRIGYEHVVGWLEGGIEAWQAAGRTLDSYPVVAIRDAATNAAADPAATTVLDVRQPNEWQSGVIPGSRQIFVADLPARLAELPKDRPVTVLCASGHRSSIAASVLDRAGFDVRLVAQGGAGNWPGPLERPAG